MAPNDGPRFREVVSGVASFYRADVSTFQLSMWWETLKEFDLAAVEGAFFRHMKNPDNGQFLPKPADIIKLIAGTNVDGAQTAWTKVDRAIRSVGTYQSVVFDDPLIHHVVADMGGWPMLGTKDDEAWPFVQREFETRYRGYRTSPPARGVPKLIGQFEAHNALNGQVVEPPVLLGDPAKAAHVLGLLISGPKLQITHISQVAAKVLPLRAIKEPAA